MVDFRSQKGFKQLQQAVTEGRRSLDDFRKSRNDYIKEYAGGNYAAKKNASRTPIPLIKTLVTVMVAHLVPQMPAAMVTARRNELWAQAQDLQAVINHLLFEMEFDEELRGLVLDAMFLIGIGKVTQKPVEYTDAIGLPVVMMQPVVQRISFDHWVHDPVSPHRGSACFMGHRYRIPLEEARSDETFDPVERAKLQPHSKYDVEEGEHADRTSDLSMGDHVPDKDEYEPWVELWEIFLPKTRSILTYSSRGAAAPLRITAYDGPDESCYEFLAFHDVPDQFIPLSPVCTALDLHSAVNELMTKAIRQAKRQKTIVTAQGAAMGDADRIKRAGDGEIISVSNPDATKEIRFGGAESVTILAATQLRELFGRYNGNLDLLGGIAPQSDTATQDQILSQQANRLVADMTSRTLRFVKRIMRRIAWYRFHDDSRWDSVPRGIPGTSVSVTARFNPLNRQGRFEDHDFDVDPYSLTPQTPETKWRTIQECLQAFAPFSAQMEQQGLVWNFDGLIREYAKARHMTSLERIIFFKNGSSSVTASSSDRPPDYVSTASPNTHRTYERIGRSGQSPDSQMVQSLLQAAGREVA